ncbi:Atrazine chlorohydrolase [Neomoorella glycerini]|uniref:Atrazine chlorohydrolase n=1 Tax=Neomoorella glycerini TaxID=55779 RepID=A0A6I5ZTV5_9FIRM|nr:amidohydrolase [Moorella glycerini]QGP93109.1 Atrazine chlorohydrolase [Moorella glycerini]
MVDLIVQNGILLTMDQERRVFRGSMAINGGKIVAIGDCYHLEASKTIDATNCVVMPGMINCHTHIYQALIEGIGYDMHFEPWNWRFLFPIVSRMSPEHSAISAELASLEMIKSGTTMVCDHWYMHTSFQNIRQVAEALDRSGIRANIIYGLLDQTFAGERINSEYMTMIHDKDNLIEDARDFVREWHGSNRTIVSIGAGSSEDASEALLIKSKELADELCIQVNTHLAGWQDILAYCYRKYGMRDLEFMHSRGLTGPTSVFVHAVWLTPEEINIIAETGSRIVHCPVANALLGYGVAPVPAMLAAGIPVGLGTDGAASYTYDLFEVLKAAAMIQKVHNMSADLLTAEQALEMATIGGARVLGVDSQVGSLEIGKEADVILVDFDSPHLLPINRVVPKLVYSAKGSDVRTVIINGKIVMEDRKVLTVDEKAIKERALQAAAELVHNAGPETEALLRGAWGGKRPYWRS